MGPVFLGHYPEAFLRQAGADAPQVEPGDMEQIALPTDFLGLNVYAGNFVRAGADGQPEVLPFPRGYPEGGLHWLKITPQSMYWAVRLAAEVFGVKSFYMTESGATFDDEVTPTGEVIDLHRREYLRSYLVEVHRAVSRGLRRARLFRLVAPRQFRVGRGLREAVRHRARGVRDAEAHAQAQQPVVCGGDSEEPDCLNPAAATHSPCQLARNCWTVGAKNSKSRCPFR